MEEEPRAAEGRIIEAAIACIERSGLARVTIRGIAKEAGVNTAAINYYFRSKEKLLSQAMERTLDNFFQDWETILSDPAESAERRIRKLLDYLIEGGLRWPGITRSHLVDAMGDDRGQTPFTLRLNRALKILTQEIAGERPSSITEDLALTLVHVVSAALFPVVLPSFFEQFSGLDLRDAGARERYVDRILNGLSLP